jgi:ABC-2 type transport system ATP-binding protein
VDGPLSDNGRARSRVLEAGPYPGLAEGSTTPVRPIALTGGAQVVTNPPGGSPAAISSLPGVSGTAATALAAFAGGLPGQVARFTSAPLTELTIITGTSRIPVQVAGLASASTAGADDGSGPVLFASLSKVNSAGVRTLAGNAVAAVRLPTLPTDGSPVTVTVQLPAVAFQVESGSRVQVSLSTTDQGYAGPSAPAVYRISAGDSPVVTVPEVGGERVSAGDVPIGLLIALIALAIAAVVGLVLAGRVRHRTSDVDAELVDLPLRITGLGKAYPGGVKAVTDVSFDVRPGMVLGLLGPNGAGKTTTLRMVMGLITPTSGEIRVFGQRIRPGAEVLSRIGSFVEGSGFLPHLSGRANLELYWRATGRPAPDAHLDVALAIAGLGSAVNRRVRTYSQGMRQRLAIAQSMLGLPDLLLLDEPTNGLDPPQIHAMREVLRRYAASGRTVLVSSHLLSEVEQTCSHVVVVHQGRTIASGTVAELVAASGEMVFVVDDPGVAAAVLRGLVGIGEVEVVDGAVQADLAEVAPAVAIAALVSGGVALRSAAPRNRLEDVFLELVGSASKGGPS